VGNVPRGDIQGVARRVKEVNQFVAQQRTTALSPVGIEEIHQKGAEPGAADCRPLAVHDFLLSGTSRDGCALVS
jgi:hypothetical protein